MVSNATGGDELAAELGETLKEEELLIGPTQRPDGTLRKPIPIRAGFVPQDQVPIYQSRDALAGLVKDEDSEKNDLLPADDWDDLPEAVESGSSKMNELPLSGNASLVSYSSDSRECSTPEKQLQDIDEHIRALGKKELENEIAEVLYDLNQSSQGPSSKKEDLREVNRSRSDTKSCVSSPISNSSSTNDPVFGPKSTPFSAVLPKRKRPRQVLENSSYGARSSPVSAKPEMVQIPKSEILSPNFEIIPGSVADNGYEIGGKTDISLEQPAPESVKLNLEFKPVVTEELQESRDVVAKEEVSSPEEKESHVVRTKEINSVESTSMVTASFAATLNKTNSMVSEVHNSREEKFEIDLMLPPPRGRSSHKGESKIDISTKTVDQTPILSVLDSELKLESRDKEYEKGMAFEEKKGEGTKEEAASEKGFVPQDELSIYQSRDALAVKNENSENDLPENVEVVSSKNELTSFGNASLVTSPSDSRECSTIEKQLQDTDELIQAVEKNLKKLTERRRMLEQLEKDAKLKGLRR